MILNLNTGNRTEMLDITSKVQDVVMASGMMDGLCMVYVPHTTAAVTINENADPAVQRDMLMILNRIIPWEADYHHMEGNSPAHIKATLTGASEMVAVENGRLVLGTWQGIFFCEFDGPRTRNVHVRLIKG